MSASVNLPLHHKVQKFSSGTGSLGWPRKKGRKTVVCVCASNVLGVIFAGVGTFGWQEMKTAGSHTSASWDTT